MNNTELQHLKKNELISEIQKLERKNKSLEKEIKNLKEESNDFHEKFNKKQKELELLQSMYKNWSIEKIIPINKRNYSEDEKKQILACNEGIEKKYLSTPEKYDNYFILNNGEWYEIKTFLELLEINDPFSLKELKLLKDQFACFSKLSTRDEMVQIFNNSKTLEKTKILKYLIKNTEDTRLHDKLIIYLQNKDYENGFDFYLEEFLENAKAEQLGNYNLYKVYVDQKDISSVAFPRFWKEACDDAQHMNCR